MQMTRTMRGLCRRRWVTVGAALALGGGLAAAMPALAAVGQESPPSTPIIIGSTVPIIDRGAVAVPWAYVACPSGGFAQLSVTLSERFGRKIASGSGFESFNCTGGIETVKVPVTPQYAPFVAGKAYEQAQLFYCGNTGCNQAEANRSVSLYTKK